MDDDRIIIHWEGREAPYRDQAYLIHIKDIDYYYKEWKKIETDICVDCVVYDTTDKRVGELKQENFELRNKISVLSKDMDSLKSKFRILEKAIKQGLLIDTLKKK